MWGSVLSVREWATKPPSCGCPSICGLEPCLAKCAFPMCRVLSCFQGPNETEWANRSDFTGKMFTTYISPNTCALQTSLVSGTGIDSWGWIALELSPWQVRGIKLRPTLKELTEVYCIWTGVSKRLRKELSEELMRRKRTVSSDM